MQPRCLTLLVPDVFRPIQETSQQGKGKISRSPALKKLLARSRAVKIKEKGLEGLLFELFSIPASDRYNLPLAPLILRSHGISVQPDHYYMFADPVHLRADRDSVIMLGNEHLEILDTDAAQLLHNINEHFHGDKIRLEPISGRHWYLSIPQVQKIHTTPLTDVVGQRIQPYLPDGEDSRYWRGILNEMQMLLCADDVNRAREAKGEPVINSLWFWGGGQLPAMAQTSWTTVHGNSDLLRALAMNAGLVCEDSPEDASSWYNSTGPGEHLVMLSDINNSRKYTDFETYFREMSALESDWFLPLLDMLKSSRISRMTLYLNTTSSYYLTSQMARRWWKDLTNRKSYI